MKPLLPLVSNAGCTWNAPEAWLTLYTSVTGWHVGHAH